MTGELTEIVVFGVSGDLSLKKIFPSLWGLFKTQKLNDNIKIAGFSRRKIDINEFISSLNRICKPHQTQIQTFNDFTTRFNFFDGDYQDNVFREFDLYLLKLVDNNINHNRIFYFALPPSVYGVAASLVRKYLCNNTGFVRIVLEKPFGFDLESASLLNQAILGLFEETQIYRIDHYLGKEMVQNILAIRFANFVISSLWDNQHISSILISFKEDIGVFGRGAYYDSSGVIRDIIQNHMMQVFSLLAMEQPKSLHHNDVKNAKNELLKKVLPIDFENVVLGQYVSNPNADVSSPASKGYKDDPTVPKDSNTPTFANIVLYVDNDRWRGVPFILKAGKALKERKAEIRIQFKSIPSPLFDQQSINELVIRMQPDECIYLKVLLKTPGTGYKMNTSELDLTYKDRHKDLEIPEAYERLILDLIVGSHINFVRSDELEESWKIFTPLLKDLENQRIKPIDYEFGSRGPVEADNLNLNMGFIYDPAYKWTKTM